MPQPDVLIPALRAVLARCIAVMNAKGGVGKTSLLANLGTLLATFFGYRVLLVEFDPQTDEGVGGNLGDDLGYADDPEIADDGLELAGAILDGRPPVPKQGIRENVDVLPGGFHLKKVVEHLHGRDDAYVAGVLARSLAPIAHLYHAILIDCPPGDDKMQTAALGAAKYLISPTKADKSSRKAIGSAGRKFAAIQAFNPGIELLGLVLFALPTSATKIRAQVLADIQAVFRGQAPILGTVRAAEKPAFDAREQGLAIHEMTAAAGGADLRKKIRGRHRVGKVESPQEQFAKSADDLARDYYGIAQNVNDGILKFEGHGK